MIRTILFDFGNVLGFFDHRRAIERLKTHTELEATELALILYGAELEIAYENGQISTARYFELARADGRLDCSLEQFVAAFVDIFTENHRVTSMVPKLKPHYRLILASNTNDAHYHHYRQQFDHVLKHFDHLVVSHEIGARKPHRAFFEHCQRLAGCEPNECLFIDDMPSNVHAAETFGWQGIILKSPDDLIVKLNQLQIKGLDDIASTYP